MGPFSCPHDRPPATRPLHLAPSDLAPYLMDMSLVIVTTTLPTEDAADLLATELVDGKYAACVQVQGPIESTYRWEGAIERAEEWLCQCKAPAEKLEALMARIRELHPYEVPEIVAVRAEAVSAEYLEWARKSVE